VKENVKGFFRNPSDNWDFTKVSLR
jgi:hypothetical protein